MAVEPAEKMASRLLIPFKMVALDSNKYHLELCKLKVDQGTWLHTHISVTFCFGQIINYFSLTPKLYSRVLHGIVLHVLSSPGGDI